MPVLDFDRAPAPKQPRKIRRLLEFGTITALLSIGVAYAIPAARNAIITLSGDNAVEFGQGVVTAAACDSSIKITPVSEFTNTDELTSTAARFPMNVIKVEGVDLTPEGWDLSLPTPALHEHFNPNLDPELRSWDSGFEGYAGKYKKANGTWANTCEGKVLLLRAYTNNSDYDEYTVAENSTDSPLWLNRIVGPPTSGANAGVGIRVYYVPMDLYPDILVDAPLWVTDVFVNNGGSAGNSDLTPIEPGGAYGDGFSDSWWLNPSIEIRLRGDLYSGALLPVESRLVDKITIESTVKESIDWQVDEDWAGVLGILS